jgi:hypothetical protein
MSTISDALKKAQKQRASGQSGLNPPSQLSEAKQPVERPAEKFVERSVESSSGPTYRILAMLLLAICVLLVFQLWNSRKVGHARAGVRENGQSASLPPTLPPAGPVAKQAQPAASNGAGTQAVVTVALTGPAVPAAEAVAAKPPAPVKVEPQPAAVNPPAPTVVPPVEPVPVSRPKADAKQPPPATPVLSGTFYSPKNPVAIINGESVKVGETVGGYQVLEILAESVRLGCDGDEIVVKLK